jgi:hypothetical protein
VEIPRKPIHRQFNIHVGQCRQCHHRVQGRHPLQTSDALGAAAAQLGPDAQAAVVELNKQGGLSHGKVTRCLESFFGIRLSRGGSVYTVLRAASRCESLGWQSDLDWSAGAGGPDVGVADLLAVGAFGPGLPEPAAARPAIARLHASRPQRPTG